MSVTEPRGSMTETITAIQEFEDRNPDGSDGEYSFDGESGFDIVTTVQTITLAIDAYQSCCESWGYFLTEDEPTKFIGAELRGVAVTDTNRSKRQIVKDLDWSLPHDPDVLDLDCGDVMFVDIETDRGVLQFVAYNAHNGYYGHTARVSSAQLQHKASL